jgi:hypothetical protein
MLTTEILILINAIFQPICAEYLALKLFNRQPSMSLRFSFIFVHISLFNETLCPAMIVTFCFSGDYSKHHYIFLEHILT